MLHRRPTHLDGIADPCEAALHGLNTGSLMPSDFTSLLKPMLDELRPHPLFMPSEFWTGLARKNVEMLEREGLDNFKRTVANNYFNWLIFGRSDPQYDNVVRTWLRRPNPLALLFRVSGDTRVQTVSQDAPKALTAKQAWRYGLFVSMLWDVGRRIDRRGILNRLYEPLLGNPIRIIRGGRLITQDLVNSGLELGTILDLPCAGRGRMKVAELGAGYGRLAYAYLATQPGQYFIFDIPPALLVSQWYIQGVFPNKKVFAFRRFERWDEVAADVAAADVAFFTSNQLALVPDSYFDIVTSISTMPELTAAQVKMFLAQFVRTSAGHIFLKQWLDWKNPDDGTHLSMNDYDLGKAWDIALDRKDPINPRFFNRVWSRL
jgi:putative sugar O-methyltransferase